MAGIRDALLACGVGVWDDARQLVAGDQLAPAILQAIDQAEAVVVVLSPRTVNSRWVTREVRHALAVQKRRGPDYRVIPVMVGGIEPAGLHMWFGEEPVGLKIAVEVGGVQRALPSLIEGLGLQLPVGAALATAVAVAPVAELTLELRDPSVERGGGTLRGAATAELVYRPADAGAREVRSRRFRLTAPLGPIEAGELRWYLERYVSWPSGVFQERARAVEARLPEWGKLLHAAALEHGDAREAYEAWKRSGGAASRRLTIRVDRDLATGAQPVEQADAAEGATLLLGLPWELVHDGGGFLFRAAEPVGVRRALPNRTEKAALVTGAPLRVLLCSPRPEDDVARYIDHRVSARPVVEALAALGELAELTLLSPPTFAALTAELDEARRRKRPYHIVHFDGHGVYSKQTGLGALCFENADDEGKVGGRRSDVVDAARLAEAMHNRRVPLFFLEACQTAVAEKDPTASVAGTLLQGGVASVVAMTHAVLVETARRFVTEFYGQLLVGRRVGEALLAGQRELAARTFRHRTFQGELHLQDWFVPVLYQEEEDPQLIREVPSERVREVLAKQRTSSLGELPAAPAHGFVGRSRELLAAERLLARERYAVLRGEGGEGKTTLAAELARWLVATQRFDRAAFAALDRHGDARAVLHALGGQLVVDFASKAGQDAGRALLEVERALVERRTMVVLDNMESVLPPEPGAPAGAFEPEVLEKVLELARRLAGAGETRVVFTSRQALPAPFADNHVVIGRLDRREAIDLVADVLGEEEAAPQADDPGESEDEVAGLVDAVGCHARSLVLVAREVAASGVRHATARLTEIMAALHARHPDDRERSLYASVELSLRRLPTGMREAIRPLGVFQGGGHLAAMAQVLGIDLEKPEPIHAIAASLVRVGLAEPLEYGYLRLDPALGPLLTSELGEPERAAARDRWARAMAGFTGFLYKLAFGDDPRMVAVLTSLDLANLLGALEHLAATAEAELAVGVATQIEGQLQFLGRPKALARASRARAVAAAKLGGWSHARCLADSQAVDRLLDAGRFPEAIAAARAVLARAQAAGEGAYGAAAYDTALAHLRVGRAVRMGGDAASALAFLDQARDRLQRLAGAGNLNAAAMASAAITETGDCLRALGRLDEAVLAYEEAINLDEQRGAERDVAVGKIQLGTVWLFKGQYREAVEAFEDARRTFEQLSEPRTVAVSWHQIGMVHKEAGNHEAAEKAYQASLRINVQTADRSGEANTLGELGNLYRRMGRVEEAVSFYRQAATVFGELQNPAAEGRQHGNLAYTFFQLRRHDEARREILLAIECGQPFGHTAEPWKAFAILANIERAAGNAGAADVARSRAIEAYLAYRRDGGENLGGGGEIFRLVEEAIAGDQIQPAEGQLAALGSAANLPAHLKPLLPKLQAILRGARDPALAADPDLDFDDAVELTLLLESLAARPLT